MNGSSLTCVFLLQCDKLKELVAKLRETLGKKDDLEPEEIKKQTNELQQASLKLFEMAYKKVVCVKNAIVRDSPHDSRTIYSNAFCDFCFQMAAERESQNQQQSQQEPESEKKEEKN